MNRATLRPAWADDPQLRRALEKANEITGASRPSVSPELLACVICGIAGGAVGALLARLPDVARWALDTALKLF